MRLTVTTTTGTTVAAAAAAASLTAIAASSTWYAVDDGPPPATTALGHAITCACQLVAFAAIVYVLSAYCGVRIVHASVQFGGRRDRHCRSDAALPLSEPGGAAHESDSADDHLGLPSYGRTKHRRRRKIKSAAPLLQR